MSTDPSSDDPYGDGRAQAYTLEGVIGAILLLTALLFAMESAVVMPSTDGAVDPTVRAELRQQARDVLARSVGDGSLSRTVRYWNNSTVEQTFAGGLRPEVGYANATPPTAFGSLLDEQFVARGYRVNVVVTYQTGAEPATWRSIPLVTQGVPSEDAVVATYPVSLYDDDVLTGPRSASEPIAAAHRAGQYPIPDIAADGPLYNILEVRLVVW